MNEVAVMCSLDHLNIVQCRGAFIKASLHAARCGVSAQALTQQPPLPHPVQDLVFNIVMEYCAHGELAHFISARQQPLGESEVMFFFVQIIMALHHVHSRNVMHRDLKPQNVFIAEGGACKRSSVKLGVPNPALPPAVRPRQHTPRRQAHVLELRLQETS
jgi:serine/threonine protein kinase